MNCTVPPGSGFSTGPPLAGIVARNCSMSPITIGPVLATVVVTAVFALMTVTEIGGAESPTRYFGLAL